MRVISKSLIVISILLLTLSTFGLSQVENYKAGVSAFESRDFPTALKYLKPYADSGDSIAEYMVGFCYYNRESEIQNDSIAEHYLLTSAEKKYELAMGLLAALYFQKSAVDARFRINAWVWAEIAAAYDPIQRSTSTRYVIKTYLSESHLKRAQDILREKKIKFDRIDVSNFK